ncbi:MAG: hypothetical protein ACI87E_005177 [Mariniblastus sp.]|jgi:hypothetical protein
MKAWVQNNEGANAYFTTHSINARSHGLKTKLPACCDNLAPEFSHAKNALPHSRRVNPLFKH